MSQLVEGTFQCGDGEALMTYVYGESSPAGRKAIAAHVATCQACADEVVALGSTREQLAAWTPPPQTLGFQITRRADSPPPADAPSDAGARTATILKPAAWWNRPLPAWAQMAAAVAIFTSGVAIGSGVTMGSRGTAPVATQGAPSVAARPVATAAPAGVTREELARVEQQLKTEIAKVRTATPAAEPTAAMMQRVNQMIAASEGRQRQELEFRTAQLVQDFANRRVDDLARIEKRFGVTNTRVLGNQQNLNSLAQRVGLPIASPYVP